jgi:hypothetical protein
MWHVYYYLEMLSGKIFWEMDFPQVIKIAWVQDVQVTNYKKEYDLIQIYFLTTEKQLPY